MLATRPASHSPSIVLDAAKGGAAPPPSATRRDGAKQQLEGQAVPAADALCSAAGLRLADDPREESRRRRELCAVCIALR